MFSTECEAMKGRPFFSSISPYAGLRIRMRSRMPRGRSYIHSKAGQRLNPRFAPTPLRGL